MKKIEEQIIELYEECIKEKHQVKCSLSELIAYLKSKKLDEDYQKQKNDRNTNS